MLVCGFLTATGSNIDENSLQPLSRPLLATLVANIKLAIGLVADFPINLRPLYFPKLEKQIGMTLEHFGNPLLLLLCNDEALPWAKILESLVIAYGNCK